MGLKGNNFELTVHRSEIDFRFLFLQTWATKLPQDIQVKFSITPNHGIEYFQDVLAVFHHVRRLYISNSMQCGFWATTDFDHPVSRAEPQYQVAGAGSASLSV